MISISVLPTTFCTNAQWLCKYVGLYTHGWYILPIDKYACISSGHLVWLQVTLSVKGRGSWNRRSSATTPIVSGKSVPPRPYWFWRTSTSRLPLTSLTGGLESERAHCVTVTLVVVGEHACLVSRLRASATLEGFMEVINARFRRNGGHLGGKKT